MYFSTTCTSTPRNAVELYSGNKSTCSTNERSTVSKDLYSISHTLLYVISFEFTSPPNNKPFFKLSRCLFFFI